MKAKRIFIPLVLSVAGLVSSHVSYAESTVTAKVSTLGAGLEYAYEFNPKFSVVGGVNGATYDYDQTSNNVKYEGTLELSSFATGVRYAPWEGAFFLGAGVLFNQNDVNLDAKPNGNSYTFNGTTYTSNDLSLVNAKVKFPDVAPSLSLGWQAKLFGSQVSLTPELGVIFQGKPKLSTRIICNASASTCNQARANIEKERQKLQKDLDGLSVYPLLSLGIGYSF